MILLSFVGGKWSKVIRMKCNHYDDIIGNIVYGWRCYKCGELLSWFKVLRLGIGGFYG